jgi:hypothetical protein
MSYRNTLSSVAVAALLVAASGPVASAMPIDGPQHSAQAGAERKDPRQLDMHASTVQKATPKDDLRTEAAAEGSSTPVKPQTGTPIAKGDLRSEAAADPSRAPEAPVGMPTWPVDPKPIVPVSPEPVATGGGDGIEWPLSGIVVAGALLLGGTLGVAGTRYRVSHTQAA